MTFAKRVERRQALVRQMRPDKLAPAATIQRQVPAGAWSEGRETDRLARLCRRAAPLLFHWAPEGEKRLRVGVAGGQRWRWVAAGQLDGLADLLSASADEAPLVLAPLEVLDLSGLGISDWQGDLVEPQRIRLALLAPAAGGTASEESQVAFGLALDFDTRALPPAQAADLLDSLIRALAERAEA